MCIEGKRRHQEPPSKSWCSDPTPLSEWIYNLPNLPKLFWDWGHPIQIQQADKIVMYVEPLFSTETARGFRDIVNRLVNKRLTDQTLGRLGFASLIYWVRGLYVR